MIYQLINNYCLDAHLKLINESLFNTTECYGNFIIGMTKYMSRKKGIFSEYCFAFKQIFFINSLFVYFIYFN